MKPEDINYKMVVEAIEGEIYINKCLQDRACCNRRMKKDTCIINKNLRSIQEVLNNELEKYNFGN
jgi:rrf2 family transcriptional regulator